jgi:hypothetical protein
MVLKKIGGVVLILLPWSKAHLNFSLRKAQFFFFLIIKKQFQLFLKGKLLNNR